MSVTRVPHLPVSDQRVRMATNLFGSPYASHAARSNLNTPRTWADITSISVPATSSAIPQSTAPPTISVERKLVSTALDLSGKSLVVEVGGSGRAETETEEFSVHEQLVCTSSDFFKGALNHGFKESSDRVIPLSEFKPESFKIYLQWLYTGGIFTRQPDSAKEIASQENCRLFEAYIMGEYLCDTNFQDTIMDALLDKWLNEDKYAVSFLLARVAQETSETSQLRRLLIDVIAEEGTEA